MRQQLFGDMPFERSAHVTVEVRARALGAIWITERFDARFERELAFEHELRASDSSGLRRVETNRRAIDRDGGSASMEKKKQEGYF